MALPHTPRWWDQHAFYLIKCWTHWSQCEMQSVGKKKTWRTTKRIFTFLFKCFIFHLKTFTFHLKFIIWLVDGNVKCRVLVKVRLTDPPIEPSPSFFKCFIFHLKSFTFHLKFNISLVDGNIMQSVGKSKTFRTANRTFTFFLNVSSFISKTFTFHLKLIICLVDGNVMQSVGKSKILRNAYRTFTFFF